MLGSFRQYLSSDEQHEAKSEDIHSGRPFNNLRARASRTLPNFNLPSIADIRDFTFGPSSSSSSSHQARRFDDGSISSTLQSSQTARQSRRPSLVDAQGIEVTRTRSRSVPAEPTQSLRKRAIQMKDSAISDLRARASLNRLPSFHFSMPFSDSSPLPPPAQMRDENGMDEMKAYQRDTDNTSLTSLEVEALATDLKAENNRLRGIIEGLPKLGLPRSGPEEPFAGLSAATKDLHIVVLGGYRGSILRSADDGRMLWVPMKVGLGIRKVDLEMPLTADAEQDAHKTIQADGMLTNIGPVDISRRLLNKLRAMQDRGFCQVHEFGYDWRLGGEYLSARLVERLESLNSRVLVIAHSLGGLISLHALNKRPDLFRGILFAGTPFHGCPNILGPFRYGDGVLLNKSVLNARTNFSMRSSFMLLPTHKRCFVDIDTGKELPVDLFDPEAWREYGFSPMVADDHGDGDVGEATDVHGLLATGGVAGPSMGNAVDENGAGADTATSRPDVRGHGNTTLDARRSGKSKTGDREYRDAALQYLPRVLQSTLAFREGLFFRPDVAYPPIALLRASGTQTVRGCSVYGYAGIRDGDYSRFIFSPGDGVVTFASSDLSTLLSSEQQDNGKGVEGGGYKQHIVQDVENDRGHIGLLGDLAGVARCLEAILNHPERSTTDASTVQQNQEKNEVIPGTPTTPVLQPPIVGVLTKTGEGQTA